MEGILNPQDATRHAACVRILFHGDNPYSSVLHNVVRKCFSGRFYIGRFQETYLTFETEFYQYLLKLKPEKVREVDNLPSWLFRVAANFANSHRQKINQALGIEMDTVAFSVTLDRDDSEESEMDEQPQRHPDTGHHRKQDDTEDDTDDDEPAESSDSSAWAEDLLNGYIDKIPHAYYRTVIRALSLEGMDPSDFAEEQGKKVSAIYNDLSRAMDALVVVALDDIKWRTRTLYSQYGDLLTQQQQDLLTAFYDPDVQLETLALKMKVKPNEVRSKIVGAYKALQKMARHQTR